MGIEVSSGGMSASQIEGDFESIRRMKRLEGEPIMIHPEELPDTAEPVVAYADEAWAVDWQVWQLPDGTMVKTIINYEGK